MWCVCVCVHVGVSVCVCGVCVCMVVCVVCVFVCVCVWCVCSVNCTKTLTMRAAETSMLGKVEVCKLWTVLRASRTYSTGRIQRSVLSSSAVSCGNISCVARNGTGRWEGSLKRVLNHMCPSVPYRLLVTGMEGK